MNLVVELVVGSVVGLTTFVRAVYSWLKYRSPSAGVTVTARGRGAQACTGVQARAGCTTADFRAVDQSDESLTNGSSEGREAT